MRQIDPTQQSEPSPPQPDATAEQSSLPLSPHFPAPQTEETGAVETSQGRRSHLRRFRLLYLGVLAILLLVFVPPLVNIGRYQRRVATSIGNSLGRPVHLDRVSLSLLPVPGLTIENLVVGEDPDFGSEPIIRANSVHATIRIPSLWRRQIEFSSISFTDPSVNLVHAANGRWNIEGILLQASRIETAPTGQRKAGPAPRFPYIEATGARLNIKQEQEKLPFSLTDADFALWLPDPHQWRLRLRAHPIRTDANVSDTGTIELESTLGAAPSLSQVPFNMQGQWRSAPLGEATHVLFGHDAGWRGEMNLSANIRGTFGESAVTAHLQLAGARPADFVPEQPLSAEVECYATATGIFHAFEDLRCSWPPATAPHTPTIALTGTIPNVHHIESSSLQLGTSGIPASRLVSWMRAISPHVPADLAATGILTGSLSYEGAAPTTKTATDTGHWQGQLTLSDASLNLPGTGGDAATLFSGDIHLHSVGRDATPRRRATALAKPPAHGFVLAPAPLFLGGHDPATLEGHFDSTGYTLHLTGSATQDRLETFAQALPPIGDGLLKALPPSRPDATAFHIDLTATRPWKGTQTWNVASAQDQPAASHAQRHHRH